MGTFLGAYLSIDKIKKPVIIYFSMNYRLNMWALRGSNPRPPACKAGALNQLS